MRVGGHPGTAANDLFAGPDPVQVVALDVSGSVTPTLRAVAVPGPYQHVAKLANDPGADVVTVSLAVAGREVAVRRVYTADIVSMPRAEGVGVCGCRHDENAERCEHNYAEEAHGWEIITTQRAAPG
jgi:hypothetical protein